MDAEQIGLAIGVVFALLAGVIIRFGKAKTPEAWLQRLARKSDQRRIGVIESRVLSAGFTLHLVQVDSKEFLLAQTGNSCTTISCWQVENGVTGR
jgi:hypothetical protein